MTKPDGHVNCSEWELAIAIVHYQAGNNVAVQPIYGKWRVLDGEQWPETIGGPIVDGGPTGSRNIPIVPRTKLTCYRLPRPVTICRLPIPVFPSLADPLGVFPPSVSASVWQTCGWTILSDHCHNGGPFMGGKWLRRVVHMGRLWDSRDTGRAAKGLATPLRVN